MNLIVTKTLLSGMLLLFNCAESDICAPGQSVTQKEPVSDAVITSDNLEDPLKRSITLTPKKSVLLDVPFSSQAPYQNWVDPYNEACEETDIIMVEYYLRGDLLDQSTADREILDMVSWQRERGFGNDISIASSAFHARTYYNRSAYTYYDQEVTEENIKKLLSNGHPVIIPASGPILDNPNFINGGPPYHMIVLTGYDSEGFIANDPGTQFGAQYKYTFATVMSAIHDWTGSKATIEQGRRAMLVIMDGAEGRN